MTTSTTIQGSATPKACDDRRDDDGDDPVDFEDPHRPPPGAADRCAIEAANSSNRARAQDSAAEPVFLTLELLVISRLFN